MYVLWRFCRLFIDWLVVVLLNKKVKPESMRKSLVFRSAMLLKHDVCSAEKGCSKKCTLNNHQPSLVTQLREAERRQCSRYCKKAACPRNLSVRFCLTHLELFFTTNQQPNQPQAGHRPFQSATDRFFCVP